tara:strand:+ start:472 stop:687 length:216 start_codon:yes stop_codon:yes gene_type:complete
MVLKHLDYVGETYFQHMRCAFSIALKCQLAVGFQILHGFLPFINPPKGLDTKSLANFLLSKTPDARRTLLD